MKKLVLSLSLALLGAAVAQTVIVSPTTGTGADKKDVGTNKATVSQTVKLILPPRTALHLDVSDLVFDLTPATFNSDLMQCVQGNRNTDVETRLGADFWNQLQVVPNGVSYTVPTTASWLAGNPKITLQGVKRLATTYPPLLLDEKGELVAGSKDNFVCFRSFILQQFSNLGNFKLSVSRDDPKGTAGHQKIYIQGNTCKTIYEGATTGLYALPSGSTRELTPISYTVGTTGSQADDCDMAFKSWLDSLIVVAVKINGDPAGTNTATLTYTLDSRATAFTAADSASKGAESY